MDFPTFIDAAWTDHATDPEAVARRLPDGVALVADEPQLLQLINLAHHVHGEHLGDWPAGIAFLQSLTAGAPHAAGGPSVESVRRCIASLRLSQGDGAALEPLTASDRVRVLAMAASNLGARDTDRAAALLNQALDEAQRAALPDTDPMHRALAANTHNLACTLQDKAGRSPPEATLMIEAAQASRAQWAIAGTWLEHERAEYRLARCWLEAGDLAQARRHAQNCLEIVRANDGAPLEQLFGWEALGRVERAAGNATGHAQALAHAREAFAALAEADQAWCAASVEALAA
jgi:hypothetical protein